MDLKNFDWKGLIGSVAPTLATALGGPLAGVAVSALSQTILGNTEGTEQDIATALAVNKDPELLLKLKQADQTFAVKMKELDIDIEKINAADRDSARQRQIKTGDNTPNILAYIIIFGFMGTAIAVLSGWGKVESVLAGTIIGYMSAKAEMVLSYFFGSSSGSKQKTALMGEALKGK